ncbi:MAG TPA: amphi-Trp domain-containing protein [Pseudogracilibacillus sp.]|nr:amphi-Trp domain-containing protein [Pseudogracilibacillus sp.]
MTKKRQKIVHVDHEQKMSLDEAVNFLETIVSKLKNEGEFTLTHAGKTYTVSPASQVELEVKLEEKGNERQFEVELEWTEGAESTSGGLEIS